MYDLATKAGTCYLWTEIQGGRGSSDIGTCLIKHISNLPENIKTVRLHSDSCFGQNRNKYIACALLYAVTKSNTIESITLSYLETGHTQMECDSMHSAIEQAKSGINVFVPSQWETVMNLARRNNPYIVANLTYDDFYDLKKLENAYGINFQNDTCGKKINWINVRSMKVVHDEQYKVYLKYSYDEDFRCFQKRRKGRRSQDGVAVEFI